jgi:ATP-dependent DNA helicase RecG
MASLSDPVAETKGVGEQLAAKYAQIGVHTISDLIEYYPRRYDDFSQITPIARIKPGVVTVKAIIKQAKGRYVRRGMHITEAVASDETGSVRIVWFNQPYRAPALKKGVEYYISGQFEFGYQRLSIMNPSVELVSEFPVNTARIVPIYRVIKGLKSLQIRKTLKTVLTLIRSLSETLPTWLVAEQKLMGKAEAVEAIHFPKDNETLEEAKRRLGFEEVFELTLAALLNKYELLNEQALAIPFNQELAKSFVAHLPFKLTDAQRKVTWQIYQDMQKEQPMNRLVEGDVGSGKTVVATMAALMAMEQNFQVALMAPTELLARQHAKTIYSLLEPLGYADQVGLLVGSLTPKQKLAAQTGIKNGNIRFIIGTHALIAEKVDMHCLGLAIIDEQHRFGVQQRKKLQAKAGHALHVLNLTATPIPRSLALTLFGELDVSVIGEKPTNRKPIITKICSPNSRKQLYEKVEKELAAGRQMFVVCPLITESDISPGKSVETVYKQMKTEFKNYRVGLLHGKLKADEKNRVMEQFVGYELDILVSTTVIEVGVDVPNATVMLLEDAERFGLAQIHQLRGRVGRSGQQGYCYLMMGDSSAPSQRLRALENSSDGFELAELDLKLRGPGAIYGTLQHGQLDLRVAKLTDVRLIASARKSAQEFIDKKEDIDKYAHLKRRVQKLRAVTNLN